MKHLDLELEKLEQRIAPGLIFHGCYGSDHSKSNGSKSKGHSKSKSKSDSKSKSRSKSKSKHY
jgi:hypothetical protein